MSRHMLRSIAAFEFRYILRSPQAWFVALVFFAMGTLAFGYMSGEGATDILALGRNVPFNGTFYIAIELAAISLAAFFFAPTFVGAGIIKDREHEFDQIVFATPVPKFSYLFGRFLGSFGALLVTFLAAPLGMILCPLWAFGVPEGSLGSFDVRHYLLVVLIYALPTLLFISSLVFVVAVVTRQTFYTQLLSLAALIFLVVGLLFSARARMFAPATLSLIDPTLLVALSGVRTYWTPEQLSTTLLSTDPWGSAVLLNRLVMTVLALAFLGLSYLLFSFTRHAGRSVQTRPPIDPPISSARPAMLVRRAPAWSTGVALRQFLLRTWFEFRAVFFSLPFLLLMLVNLGSMLDSLSYAAETYFPETYVFANALAGSTVGIIALFVIVVFCPEIIWREHKSRFHEIIHALPVPNWVFVTSKLLALLCILVAIVVMNTGVALYFQREAAGIDLGLYLQRCVYMLVPYVCIAVLVIFLQVLANNRFVGTALTAVYALVTITLLVLGFQHPLYQNFLVADGALPLSGMDAAAGFQVKGYWLRAYWVSIAALLLLLTYALFARGALQSLKYRLMSLQKLRAAQYYVPACLSLLAIGGTGAFIYYNTNVLNRYVTQDAVEAQLAQYEVRYRQYEDLPMPRITDIDLELAIFPDTRRLEFEAGLTVVNKTAQPINAVHLEVPFGIEVETLTVPAATLRSADTTHRYDIYDLTTPMAPGERRELRLKGYKQLRGFRANNEDVTLVGNGTYFEINTLIPHIGFSWSRMLSDPATRKKYGLDPVMPVGKLDDDPARSRYRNNSPLRSDSDLVNFAATVSTVPGQTAVTAGRLVGQWQENGRSYFRYRTDVPVYPVIPFFSARYAVLRDSWRNPDVAAASDAADVDIEIYYHPEHAYHLDVMMQGLKDGLTRFSADYGPYQYRQLRVMEYPGYRTNSRSLPTTIAHSEANGPVEREPANTYEHMAHELSHHWWGHQILGAMVEGGTVLGEGLASYSARMLVEQRYGKEFYLHRAAISANRRYLRGRNTDQFGEKPLYRAMGQNYLEYGKGESAMYALQDQLGEDVVNAALREFVTTYGGRMPPYVVSTDFLRILKRVAGAQHQGLIEDLFEKITLYEFAVDNARAEALNDGRYRVTLDITTAKVYADESGSETAAEFNSAVRIGLFTKRPYDRSFRIDEDVVLLELRSPRNGASTLEVVVDELPLFAGINPYDILIERNSADNIRPVTLGVTTGRVASR